MDCINLTQEEKNYFLSSYNISEKDLLRLIDDVGGMFDITLRDYVQKKHINLQRQGLKNSEIYLKIQEDLKTRRFRSEELSVRQIRRIIYG